MEMGHQRRDIEISHFNMCDWDGHWKGCWGGELFGEYGSIVFQCSDDGRFRGIEGGLQ